MPNWYGRRILTPVVVLALASGCTSTARQRTDNLRSQLRAQQHVVDGQARKIDQLTQERDVLAQERDSLKTQLDEQRLLLQVLQDKANSSEKDRSLVSEQLEELKKRLEELAIQDPDAFHWDSATGTFGVAAEVLFHPGKADLLPGGADALRKVVPILRDREELVRVDGHTDSDPIKLSKWDDNWQLAGERARRVLKFLAQEGIDSGRLFFAGYADTRPKAENTSKDGKRMNRRVELVPLPPQARTLPEDKVSSSKQAMSAGSELKD